MYLMQSGLLHFCGCLSELSPFSFFFKSLSITSLNSLGCLFLRCCFRLVGNFPFSLAPHELELPVDIQQTLLSSEESYLKCSHTGLLNNELPTASSDLEGERLQDGDGDAVALYSSSTLDTDSRSSAIFLFSNNEHLLSQEVTS